MVKKIHEILLNDRRLKVRELANMVGISKSAVHRIWTKNSDMRKLCVRWVPHLLTMEQKQHREDVSIECLAKFHNNKADFPRRFITIDKTWVHLFTPETKEQSKHWTARGESALKKASDKFHYPNLKNWLGGQRFDSNEQVEFAVIGYFEELDGFHY